MITQARRGRAPAEPSVTGIGELIEAAESEVAEIHEAERRSSIAITMVVTIHLEVSMPVQSQEVI